MKPPILRSWDLNANIARQGQANQCQANGQAPAQAAQAVRRFFAESAGSAARLMAVANGPRVGAIAFDGWDTHAKKAP
jgi:uncharacterized protein (DUF1501 family)